jgi:hypothetical protein
MSIFKEWPKIPRGVLGTVVITEKMDGTNACIIIEDDKIIGVQSRKRLITPEDDNYGFAGWVSRNEEELLGLGEGYHYGEWAGLGIQGNPHCLPEKQFFLFNTARWGEHNPNTPKCCKVVQKLFTGEYTSDIISDIMHDLANTAKESKYKPEGIIVYFPKLGAMEKHTYNAPEGKWKELIK